MTKETRAEGIIVPMVTPFDTDGKVDCDAAKPITKHLISAGCSPFILGTTGEAASVPVEQRQRFVQTVVEAAEGKQPVFAGIASNCLEEAVQMANTFSTVGADFAVAHLPFYYPLKPCQIKAYYRRLADSIDLPLILYNITATTHMSIPQERVFELSEHPNIAGIKDSQRDLKRQQNIIKFCKKTDGFSHFIGWAAKGSWALLAGSNGLVPSTGNLLPGLYQQLYIAAREGKVERANRLQDETDAISAIYQEGCSLGESLAGLKIMMDQLDLCSKKVLPPLTALSAKDEQKILQAMQVADVKGNAKLLNQYSRK